MLSISSTFPPSRFPFAHRSIPRNHSRFLSGNSGCVSPLLIKPSSPNLSVGVTTRHHLSSSIAPDNMPRDSTPGLCPGPFAECKRCFALCMHQKGRIAELSSTRRSSGAVLHPRSGRSSRLPCSQGCVSAAPAAVTRGDPQRSSRAQLFLGTSRNLPQFQGLLLSFAATHCEISPLEMLTAKIYGFCSFPLMASAGEALAKDERCWHGMDVRRRLQRLPTHRVAL